MINKALILLTGYLLLVGNVATFYAMLHDSFWLGLLSLPVFIILDYVYLAAARRDW
jgi:hypothetical protein